jgi:spore germination protein YaaH
MSAVHGAVNAGMFRGGAGDTNGYTLSSATLVTSYESRHGLFQFARRWCTLVIGAAMLASPGRPATAQRVEALWYATGGATSTQSFLAHASQISVVSPQVFAFDRQGRISGHVDPKVIAAAKEHGVKLVPLVMNPGFDQALMHRVLTNAESRRRAIASLVSLCRANHFDGIQFDVENVHVRDKAALTSFMQESAGALHRVGCSCSAAVVPRLGEDSGPTNYHKWIFDNWRGVYDYKALADSLDFLSYMTYAQHTGGSTPGPVAGFTWMEQSLEYVLSLGVPPTKISLGIPSYSDWWYPSWTKKDGPRMRGGDISYRRVRELVDRYRLQPVWDDREKTAYAIWSDAGVNDLMWIEDARAFEAKLGLVRKYGLRGYSVWVLGTEDPAVWSVVK